MKGAPLYQRVFVQLRKKGLKDLAAVGEDLALQAAFLSGSTLVTEQKSHSEMVRVWRIDWTKKYVSMVGPVE
jgi:hypothetical protein